MIAEREGSHGQEWRPWNNSNELLRYDIDLKVGKSAKVRHETSISIALRSA